MGRWCAGFGDSEKPGHDQVAEEDAGGDNDGVHSVEWRIFVHGLYVTGYRPIVRAGLQILFKISSNIPGVKLKAG